LLIPLALQPLDTDPWPRLRLAWFDTLQAGMPRKIDPRDLPVRMVAINDPSLESFGQWPWARTIVARLLDRMTEAGGLVVGLDLLFDQPKRLSPERYAATRPDLDPETGPLGMRAVRLGIGPDTIRLQTESDGSLLLRHVPTSQLRYLSAHDDMEKDEVARHLNGKLVLIGFTASGFVDIVTTPTARQMNGVEIHAQIPETALTQTLVYRPSGSRWLESGMTAFGGGAIIVMAPCLALPSARWPCWRR
jgi:CHASE2 domain-containing sensor protein